MRGAMVLTGNQTTPNQGGVGSSTFTGSGVSFAVGWYGGVTAVAVNASAYATSPGLHIRMQGPSGNWIPICSSFLADQVYVFNAAPGQYRIQNDGSSSIGVTAVMVGVPNNL